MHVNMYTTVTKFARKYVQGGKFKFAEFKKFMK